MKGTHVALQLKSPLDWSLPTWTRERPFWWPSAWDGVLESTGVRVEEYEEDDVYVIRAEVPGIDPDRDIDLTINDAVLRLDIRRQQETHEGRRRRHRSEFSYGTFTRIITLPRTAAEKDVTATYEDGILEVRVPLNGKDADTHHVPITHK